MKFRANPSLLQLHREQIACLAQYLLSVLAVNTFTSRNWFFCFRLPVVFLGLHSWALVSYSDGDIVGHRHAQYIDHYTDFVRA